MSVDVLQEKIRKTKNPSIVMLEAFGALVPPYILEAEGSVLKGYRRLCLELMQGLKGKVPALRFGFGSFALYGEEGVILLSELMHKAKSYGYYVMLDVPELHSVMAAEHIVNLLGRENASYPCDAAVISSYLGSDVLRPFQVLCKQGIGVFPVVRSANRSAPELQDLLTGGRLVHTAAADLVNRHGEGQIGKYGYSQMGALAAASAADSLRTLRAKYKRMFLLVDGYDYPNSNAKNCSFAFDNLGHGAVVCAGSSIVGAWKEIQTETADPVAAAVESAERMKKNITRYITVL